MSIFKAHKSFKRDESFMMIHDEEEIKSVTKHRQNLEEKRKEKENERDDKIEFNYDNINNKTKDFLLKIALIIKDSEKWLIKPENVCELFINCSYEYLFIKNMRININKKIEMYVKEVQKK